MNKIILEPKKIKNIIFDLGNVLIEFHPEKYVENNIEKDDRELFYKTIFGGKEWLDLDRGTLTYEKAIEIFSEKLPKYKEIIREFFEKKIMEVLTPIEENIKIVKKLREKGYNLYILSNFHEIAFENIYKQCGFSELFHGKIVSSYCNYLKPEYEIYELILNEYKLFPKETIFIDDSYPNIIAAREKGINAIYLKDPKLLEEKLNFLF